MKFVVFFIFLISSVSSFGFESAGIENSGPAWLTKLRLAKVGIVPTSIWTPGYNDLYSRFKPRRNDPSDPMQGAKIADINFQLDGLTYACKVRWLKAVRSGIHLVSIDGCGDTQVGRDEFGFVDHSGDRPALNQKPDYIDFRQ